jgi:hypothetical protein
MNKIKEVFDETFSDWDIKLPEEKENGFIQKQGWLIQYCYGKEEEKEFLDYYASHRMTNDCHKRIYEDGSTMDLPAFYTIYRTDDDGSGERAMKKNNQEVAEALTKKGFTKFTINMAIAAGIA